MNGLSFDQLRDANVKRCEQAFHRLDDWTPTDWATAMAGEVGEACNFIKKLRRFADADAPYNRTLTAGHSMNANATCSACGDLDGCHLPAKQRNDRRDITANIGKELADVIIYADLLAARLGIDLGIAVANKFNEVSERVRSDITLSLEHAA
jgi:NTP pyrophosphatase (non-canonical NTP hydrolase)